MKYLDALWVALQIVLTVSSAVLFALALQWWWIS